MNRSSAKLPDAKKLPNDFNWPKRPPVVRIIRGTRSGKPIGHPDMLAQISKNTSNQGSTNTEAYKSYNSSVYRPRGRPIWADRLITSIGSGEQSIPSSNLGINNFLRSLVSPTTPHELNFD